MATLWQNASSSWPPTKWTNGESNRSSTSSKPNDLSQNRQQPERSLKKHSEESSWKDWASDPTDFSHCRPFQKSKRWARRSFCEECNHSLEETVYLVRALQVWGSVHRNISVQNRMCSSGVARTSSQCGIPVCILKGFVFYTSSKTRAYGSVVTAQNTTSSKAYLDMPKQSCWPEVRAA